MGVYGFLTTISWGSMAQAAEVSRDTYMDSGRRKPAREPIAQEDTHSGGICLVTSLIN